MSTKPDLDSAYSDGEDQHLSLGELLWLWGALAWIVVAAIVGSVTMFNWLWKLIARTMP